jgi:DNA-binding NarL/FixJ family response regulator
MRGSPILQAMETARTDRTNVFLVEDSAPIRMRLAEMLGELEGVAIVGEADTPASAIEGILRTRPHSVVLDIQLIGGSGIDVLREVRPLEPGIVFIVLTNHPDPQYRKICMGAGASYFLDKTTEFEKVREVIAELGTVH